MRQKFLLKTMLLLLSLIVGNSVWADDQVTLWSEDFSSYSKDAVPSGGTYNYTCGGTNTKIYEEALAGGSSPELLLQKSNNGTFTATIPLDNIEGDLTLTFKTNNQKIKVETTTTGLTGSLEEKASGTHTATFKGVTTSTTSITIKFTCTGSSNVRLDDILLVGTKASSGGGDTPTTYAVTYDGNGATSGDVPTDDTEYDAENNTVTVLGNTGDLAKEHYTFNGWNTKADGSGTSYAANATFTITANTKLYAQWAINTHNVTLPANDEFGTYTMSAENPVAYGTEVTLTYTPATGYEKYAATWSVNGEEIAKDMFTMPDEVVTVTVSVKKVTTSDMVIDFEDNTSTYTDWKFTNINGKATDTGVTPHGGAYFGVTAGTATASIVTKEKVDPVSLTCYVSKKSTNTATSTWTIQISSDGNSWTDAASRSASDMSKGEWKELTADLSKYSDVYVRVYYSGSTAVRCIDDLTLTVNGSAKPSLAASDVNLAYDDTSGNVNFTLTNEVEGGIVTATKEGDWITLGEVGATSVSFTATANETSAERTATITLTYTYGESETISKVVTVTQAAAPAPVTVYSTIPTLFEAATGTETEVQVTFDNWVVSGVSTNGKNVFVTDNNGNGFVIYGTSMNSTFSTGDILSGTAVTCNLKLYNGFAELIGLDASDLTITAGGTVTTANIDMANLAGVNTGALVNYNGLTCSVDNNKYYLSDGTTTLQVYNALFAFDALEDGKTYNITGIYQQYSTTKEILPRSADDIVEVVSTEPSITVDPATVNEDAYEHDGTLALDYVNLTITDMTDFEIQYYNAESEELSQAPEWIDVEVAEQDPQIGEGYVVSYVIGANDGEARTAYFKVYAMDDETNLVYSNLVTVTQAKYVAPFVPATYTLATTITSGKHYIIANGDEENPKAMGGQNNNNRAAADVEINSGVATVSSADVYEFVIQGPDANGNYTIYDETNSGYLYAASNSSNHLKNEAALDKNNNGKWSVEFDGNGVATIKAQGTNSRNWMRYNSSDGIFSCYGATSSQSDVYLYEKDDEATPTETVTITAAKYATYCSENALDFSSTSLTAYIANINGTNVEFTPVTKVPAYTGVLLKADAAGDFTINATSSVDDVTDNAFIGVTKQTTINETGIFVLMNGDKGVGFYQTTKAFTIGAHTAYLPADVAGARSFIGFDFNDATVIDGIAAESMANGEVYNLQGQRVVAPQKGLYIVNGKKVLVK